MVVDVEEVVDDEDVERVVVDVESVEDVVDKVQMLHVTSQMPALLQVAQNSQSH